VSVPARMALALKQTLCMSVRRAGVTQLAECLLPKHVRYRCATPRRCLNVNIAGYSTF
jgi:hypothetical protein